MKRSKIKSEEEKNNQSKRILSIYRLFLSHRKLTSKEVFERISNNYEDVSTRSIQRDLRILAEEGFINLYKKGRYSYWLINKTNAIRTGSFNIKESEMLSFYILKSYLNTFKGTTIEGDIKDLSDKLESLAPGEVVMEEQFYGDQNSGYYDYSNKHYFLSQCIKHIREKNWIEITYEKQTKDETKFYDIFPQFLYTYSGTIYLLAYNRKRSRDTTFIIQNIRSIKKIWDETRSIPDFDYQEFRSQRFAVFDGEVHKVRLKIKKQFKNYFENRSWHPSQKEKRDKHGNMIIEMKVPLTPDLIGWICRWADVITVLEPKSLIESVKAKFLSALENYE